MDETVDPQFAGIARELHSRRKARDLTLRDAADEVGVHWNTLRNLEAGRSQSESQLMRYAAFLGMAPNDVAARLGWWSAPATQPVSKADMYLRFGEMMAHLLMLSPAAQELIAIVFTKMVDAAIVDAAAAKT